MHGSKVMRTGAFASAKEASKTHGNIVTMPSVHEVADTPFVQSHEYAPLALELFKARPLVQHSLISNYLHYRDEREKEVRKPGGTTSSKNPETATPLSRLEQFEFNVPEIFRSDPDGLLEEVCNEAAVAFRNRVRRIVLAARLAQEAQRVGFLKRESETQWRIKLLCKSVREYWNETARRRTWPEQVVGYSERFLLRQNRPLLDSSAGDPKGPGTATRPYKRTRSPQSSQRTKRRKTSLPSTLADTSFKEIPNQPDPLRYVCLDLLSVAFGHFPPQSECRQAEEDPVPILHVPDKGPKQRKRKASTQTSAPNETPTQIAPTSTSPPPQALRQYSIHTLSALISHIFPNAHEQGALNPGEKSSTARSANQVREDCQPDTPKLSDKPPRDDDPNEILCFVRDTRTRRRSATDFHAPTSSWQRNRGHCGAKEFFHGAKSQSLSRILTLSSTGCSDVPFTHSDPDSRNPPRQSWLALPKHVLSAVSHSNNPWWVASNRPKSQERLGIGGAVAVDWSLPPRLVELHVLEKATPAGPKETSKTFTADRETDNSPVHSFASRLGVSRPAENSDTLVLISLMSLFMAPRPDYFSALLALNLLWNLSHPAELKLPESSCQKLVDTFSADPNFASINRGGEAVAPNPSDPQQNAQPFDAEDLKAYLAGVFPAPVALQEYFAQTLMKFPSASDWVKKCWAKPHIISRVDEKTFQAELFQNFNAPDITWAEFILPFDAFIFFIKRLGREKRRLKLAQTAAVPGTLGSGSPNLHAQPSRKWQPAGYNGAFVLQHALQADGMEPAPDPSGRSSAGAIELGVGYHTFDRNEVMLTDSAGRARETSDATEKSAGNTFSKNSLKVLDILPKWMVSLKLGTRWRLWSFLDTLLQNYTAIGGLIAPGVAGSDAAIRAAKSSKMQGAGVSSGSSMLSALTAEGFTPLSPENFPPPILFSRALRSILPNPNPTIPDASSPFFPSSKKQGLLSYCPGDLKQVEFFTSSLSSFPTIVTIKSCAKIARKLELSWHPLDDIVIWCAVAEQVDLSLEPWMKSSKKTDDNLSEAQSAGLLRTFSQYVQHARRAKGFFPTIIKNSHKNLPLFHHVNWTHVAHTFNLSLPPFDRYRSGKVCESKFHSLMVEYLCAMSLQPEKVGSPNTVVQADCELHAASSDDLILSAPVEISICESTIAEKTEQEVSDILQLLEKSLLESDHDALTSLQEQFGPKETQNLSFSVPEANCLCNVSGGLLCSNAPKDFIDATIRLKEFDSTYCIPLAIKPPPARSILSSERSTDNLAEFYTNVWNSKPIDQALMSLSLRQRAKGVQLGKLRDTFETGGLIGAHVLSRMLRRGQEPPEELPVGENATASVDKLISLLSLGTYFSQLQRLASHVIKSSGPNGVFTRKKASITKLQDLILMNRPLRVHLNANNACVNTLQGIRGLLTDKMSDSSGVTSSAVYQHTLLNCHKLILPAHLSQLSASTSSCLPLAQFGFAETWLHDPLEASSQCWNILDFCFPIGAEAASPDPVKQEVAINYLTTSKKLRGINSSGTLEFTKTPFPKLKFVSLFESSMARGATIANRGMPAAVTNSPNGGSYPNKGGGVGRFEPTQPSTNKSAFSNGVNLQPMRNLPYNPLPTALMGSSPSMGFGPSGLGPLNIPPQQPIPSTIPASSYIPNAPWGVQPPSYQQLQYPRLGVSGMTPGSLPTPSPMSYTQTVQAKPRTNYYDRYKIPVESGWMGVNMSTQPPNQPGFSPHGFPPHQQFAPQQAQYNLPPRFAPQGSPNLAQNPQWRLRTPGSADALQIGAMKSSNPEYWMQLGSGHPDVSRLQWQEPQAYQQQAGGRTGGMPMSMYNDGTAAASAGSWSGLAPHNNPPNTRTSGWPSSRRVSKSMATPIAGGSYPGDGASANAASEEYVGGYHQGFPEEARTGQSGAPPPMWGYGASEGGSFRATESKKFS